MDNMILKDVGTYRIELWDFHMMEDLIRRMSAMPDKYPVLENECGKFFKGFFYLGPDVPEVMSSRKGVYSEATSLSPMEMQPGPRLPNDAYHRSIVALHGSEILGMLVCEWTTHNSSFWNYFLTFIDINEDFKGNGIGTSIVESLDSSDFIKGNIVRGDSYSKNDGVFSKRIFETRMLARDYAYILSDHNPPETPTEPGIYDSHGRISRPTDPATRCP